MISSGSAWREIPVAEALRRARQLAPAAGITRITDITRLDRLGVPVAVAIRPGAMDGGLCVSTGKGLTLDDAYVGAAMEGIEMAWAEPGRAPVEIVTATARDVAGGRLDDYAPASGARIDPDAAFPAVATEDLASGERVLVPAQTVLFPFHGAPGYLGASTNGLASGSSVAEATLHALAELVERDAYSFALLRPPRLLDPATLPEPVAALDRRLRDRGLERWYFHLPNPFGLACVSVTIYDPDSRYLPTSGQGSHLSPAIAAARALTEAVQSRASFIHGGRDDLDAVLARHPPGGWSETARQVREQTELLRAGPAPLPFGDLPDLSPLAPTIPAAIELVRARLAGAGLRHVLRVALTPPELSMQVVRVVVPGLERFGHDRRHAGPRIQAFLRGELSY